MGFEDLLRELDCDFEYTQKLTHLIMLQMACPNTVEGIAEFHRLQKEIDDLKLLYNTEKELNVSL